MTDIVERLMNRHCCQDNLDQEAAKEIERLRKRVELLEGYLSGALNVIEGLVHCDTTEARKALGDKE
jgi:CHASE1-domain containing sensor protein